MSKEYQVNSTEISEKKDCKSCTNGLNMGQKFINFIFLLSNINVILNIDSIKFQVFSYYQ